MKRKKQVITLLLVVLLLFNTVVSASILGEEMFSYEMPLLSNAELGHSIFYNSDVGQQTENYFTYHPDPASSAIVTYGAKLFGRKTISQVFDFMKSNGKRPVAAINADFFSLETGVPMGPVVTDGIIRCSDEGKYAIAFTKTGQAFIDKPFFSFSIATPDLSKAMAIDYLNKYRQPYCTYLLTEDFSNTTRNSTAGLDVIIGNLSGEMKIGSNVHGTIEAIQQSSGPIDIPAGKYILTVDANAPAEKYAQVAAFAVGDEVNICVSAADSRWNSVEFAAGGAEKLITNNGVVNSDLSGNAAPRTAVGVKADGSTVFYTIDGRQDSSYGVRLITLANRLKELGCVEALNLDGGGSTAIVAIYPGEEEMRVLNSPSDGSQRSCASYLFLLNNAERTNKVERLYLYPYGQMVLSGSAIEFNTKATDNGTYAVPAPSGITYEVKGSGGTAYSNGKAVFTGDGPAYMTAKYGQATGSTKVDVVKNPSSIYIRDISGKVSALNVQPGETVELGAAAFVGRREIRSEDECFNWEVIGNVGTIDQSGRFVVGNQKGASGSIRITAGTASYEIPVSVSNSKELKLTFEDGSISGGDHRITISPERSRDKLKFGEQSMKVSYNQNDNGAIGVPYTFTAGGGFRYMNVWVYGDGSYNELTVQTSNAGGEYLASPAIKLDFVGWRNVTFELPADRNPEALMYFVVKRVAGGRANGEIYLDQGILYANSPASSVPYNVDISITGDNLVRAQISGGNMGDLDANRVEIKLDNEALYSHFNRETLQVTAALPENYFERTHKISVIVGDLYGNLTRKSYDNFVDSGEAAFPDSEGHWSDKWLSALREHSIINGEIRDDIAYFNPENNITRAEFAVIMCKLLQVNVGDYSGDMPFSDWNTVPSWAAGEVRAMYSLGVINGRVSGSSVRFDPQASITRAEAMAMMGRVMAKSYFGTELNFADNDQIPGYAADYIKILKDQNVVSGYSDNTIHPNNPIKRAEAAKMAYELFGSF